MYNGILPKILLVLITNSSLVISIVFGRYFQFYGVLSVFFFNKLELFNTIELQYMVYDMRRNRFPTGIGEHIHFSSLYFAKNHGLAFRIKLHNPYIPGIVSYHWHG